MITYHPETNVLEAARQRISYIFDNFERIIVSISGGKDSPSSRTSRLLRRTSAAGRSASSTSMRRSSTRRPSSRWST